MRLYTLTTRITATILTLITPSTLSHLPRSHYPPTHAFKVSNHTESGSPPWNPSEGIGDDGWLKGELPAFGGKWEGFEGEEEGEGEGEDIGGRYR